MLVGPYETFDLNTKRIEDVELKVQYVATPEEHAANVAASVALGYPSLERADLRGEPIAVVCFGPSLKRSRRDLRHFKYILTCSGAHKYLIDHGIVPTWHVEGDPRKHKAVFVKHPHKRVEYLIASSCHPAMFEALKGYKVRIWHTLRGADHLRGQDHYPEGHWVLTGGTNVGMRALVVARVLGFTQHHVFGMDCSGENDVMHTSDHPNEPAKERYSTVRVGNEEFRTTSLFLHYAKQFFHEALQLPDVHFTFHGDGLLPALIKQKLENPQLLAEWLEERENVVDSTIAVMQREKTEVKAEEGTYEIAV